MRTGPLHHLPASANLMFHRATNDHICYRNQTFIQPAMKRKHFYTRLLTIWSWFWVFSNLGTEFCYTPLLLFGIISLCHARSHCWSTVLFDWWRDASGQPSKLGYLLQASRGLLLYGITQFPHPSRAAEHPTVAANHETCSGSTTSPRSKVDYRGTSQQHNQPALAVPQWFGFLFLSPELSFKLSWLRLPGLTVSIRQPAGWKMGSG